MTILSEIQIQIRRLKVKFQILNINNNGARLCKYVSAKQNNNYYILALRRWSVNLIAGKILTDKNVYNSNTFYRISIPSYNKIKYSRRHRSVKYLKSIHGESMNNPNKNKQRKKNNKCQNSKINWCPFLKKKKKINSDSETTSQSEGDHTKQKSFSPKQKGFSSKRKCFSPKQANESSKKNKKSKEKNDQKNPKTKGSCFIIKPKEPSLANVSYVESRSGSSIFREVITVYPVTYANLLTPIFTESKIISSAYPLNHSALMGPSGFEQAKVTKLLNSKRPLNEETVLAQRVNQPVQTSHPDHVVQQLTKRPTIIAPTNEDEGSLVYGQVMYPDSQQDIASNLSSSRGSKPCGCPSVPIYLCYGMPTGNGANERLQITYK